MSEEIRDMGLNELLARGVICCSCGVLFEDKQIPGHQWTCNFCINDFLKYESYVGRDGEYEIDSV